MEHIFLTWVNIGVVNSVNLPYTPSTDGDMTLSTSALTLTNAASLLLNVDALITQQIALSNALITRQIALSSVALKFVFSFES